MALTPSGANHYATLGLHQRCTPEQIQDAFRILAKQRHPDLNPDSPEAVARTQELNAAYQILRDPERRQDYDQALAAHSKAKPADRSPRAQRNVAEDIQLQLEEFFKGAKLEVRVNDPGNPHGPEVYSLEVPPATAPGSRFRIPRDGGGQVVVRVRARPHFRFTVRGSHLRCDLKINARRAAQGGTESIRGPLGDFLRIEIPPHIASGEEITLEGHGLPTPRGGRGDLLVRITYRPDVQITRARAR